MLGTEKETVLDWLSPGSTLGRHSEIREKIAKNSGQWFWSSEKVQKWVKGQSSKLLICEGISMLPFLISLIGIPAGAGKSYLTYPFTAFNLLTAKIRGYRTSLRGTFSSQAYLCLFQFRLSRRANRKEGDRESP